MIDSSFAHAASGSLPDKGAEAGPFAPGKSDLTNLLGLYRGEISGTPLTHDEEIFYGSVIGTAVVTIDAEKNTKFFDMRNASPEALWAREKMITSNLPLVMRCVTKYLKNHPHCKAERLDLIQAGNEGLIWAAERYNPQKINPETNEPHRFGTYAVHRIYSELVAESIRQSSGLYIPMEHVLLANKVQKAQKELEADGTMATCQQLAGHLGITPEKVEDAFAVLDALRDMESASDESFRHTKDPRPVDPAEIAERDNTQEFLRAAITRVMSGNVKMLEVVERTAGLGDYDEESCADIARASGCKRQNIHQTMTRGHEKIAAVREYIMPALI